MISSKQAVTEVPGEYYMNKILQNKQKLILGVTRGCGGCAVAFASPINGKVDL